ncbi:hypothetical protein DERF_008024 [Dermatophagoides farinae]|uniref:Uncharacterized protein n=1 Tax=Dermatophagoides farinae TaxID=6954 RepID=A0A922L4A3_DERFA|nr:hypothetical protein DERF_008024 [Dermatophagoides farinae]
MDKLIEQSEQKKIHFISKSKFSFEKKKINVKVQKPLSQTNIRRPKVKGSVEKMYIFLSEYLMLTSKEG